MADVDGWLFVVVGTGFIAPSVLTIGGWVLTWHLKHKGVQAQAASVVGCGVVLLVALFLVTVFIPWNLIEGSGIDIRLENTSEQVIALWPDNDQSRFSDQHAAFPIHSGDSIRLITARHPSSSPSEDVVCLSKHPGVLAESTEVGLRLDPTNNEPVVLVRLPAQHCFGDRHARFEWNGSELVKLGPRRSRFILILPAVTGVLCITILGAGFAVDRRRRQTVP